MRTRLLAPALVLALALAACVPLPPPIPQGSTSGMPMNMASHGVVLTQDGVVETPEATDVPVPTVPTPGVTQIVAYLDPQCWHCADFVETNGDYLEGLVASGAATLEIHPLASMDQTPQGGSTRAVSAIAAVVSMQPDLTVDYIRAVFANQPAGAGAFEAQDLLDIAASVGISDEATLDAIEHVTFAPFATASFLWAIEHPAASSNEAIVATPTVFVNGETYAGVPLDGPGFQAFVESAS